MESLNGQDGMYGIILYFKIDTQKIVSVHSSCAQPMCRMKSNVISDFWLDLPLFIDDVTFEDGRIFRGENFFIKYIFKIWIYSHGKNVDDVKVEVYCPGQNWTQSTGI